MQRNSLYIVFAGLWLGCISTLYFLSLALGLPLIAAVLLIVVVGVLLWRSTLRHLPAAAYQLSTKENGLAIGAMLALMGCGVFLARKYGDWDAVYIYNLAARFLQDPQHWRQLFLYRDQFSHADYPLHIPATVAFIQRISGGGYKEWVPFLIALFYTVSISLLLFLETISLHRVLAAVMLVLVCCNTYYLNNGMIQCADVPLSFYLLLAFISIQRYRDQRNHTVWIVLYGISLGMCAWTKNEGLMYALILLLFHFREWRRHTGCLLWGLVPLLVVLVLFKAIYAPPNDIVSGLKQGGLAARIGDKERYKLIAAAYGRYMSEYFYVPKLGFIGYVFLCIYRRVIPGRDILVFAAFALAMTGVYLFTCHDLGWHLDNSMSRILLQWYPAFLFVLVTQSAKLMPEGDK